MSEELREFLRAILLERYGVDINDAKMYFSTQNYAFIFPGKPYMIRVSLTAKKTRGELMSELMWVDDLKQFKQTICEPNTSLLGNILEEFEYEGVTYRASMFRTARGNTQPTAQMNPMFFICVGDLLGAIHHVSTNERELGMHYNRKTMAENFAELKERTWKNVPPQVAARIEDIEARVNALPQEPGRYGICHGDFHLNNFFVEANNVWLFDFDNCVYSNYLYDVASFVQACFLMGYKAGQDCRAVLYEDMLHYFKIGYELNKECGEGYWDDLELFISFRTALSYLALLEIDDCGVVDDLSKIRQFFAYVITQDSPLDAMTTAMKSMG